jgi:hypothetical protein
VPDPGWIDESAQPHANSETAAHLYRDKVRRDDHHRAPSGGSAPKSADSGFGARHSVVDARGADVPAHPPLTLIAERGWPARHSRTPIRHYVLLSRVDFGGAERRVTG